MAPAEKPERFMRFSRYRMPLVLVLAVMLMLLPVDVEGLWWRELFNSAHVVIFAVVAYILFRHLEGHLNISGTRSAYLWTILLGLTLGVLVEIVQGFIGREMSLQDLYKDLAGLVAGISLAVFSASRKHDQTAGVAKMPLLVFIGALVFGTSALLQMSTHYIQRYVAFPVLTAFDQGWSSSFVRFDHVELIAALSMPGGPRDQYYRMVFKPGRYPGISVIEVRPDWSGYQSLRFNVMSQQQDEIALSLRVHDAAHNQDFTDRYNGLFQVHKGINEFVIDLEEIRHAPVNRAMQMDAIMGLKLFISGLKSEVVLDVSNVELL